MANDLSINLKNSVAMTQDKVLADLRTKVSDSDRTTIKQAAEDFESLFLNIVLKSMRDTVQKSGLIDGGNAEEIYSSMLDDEYAKMMAAQRHTGLADNIESFLLTSQAQSRPSSTPITEKAAGIKAYKATATAPGIAVAGKTGDNE
ncbi:MAG: rod-binding protein [Proteobacteria bacterium]|jgi:flagellar protein FlgJ|nr:rod-binding protein [Pseudomonadota bacterium]